ncbi:MAG TPA: response regulator, partial [Nevskiaceae bacterium]|nr:response regulator [Nevskiaceae bacterium]
VRSIVELHGGSVRAVSAGPGRGSEFIVRLPALAAAPAQAEPPEAAAEGERKGRRILVVDDNKDAADSLAILLREAGHTVETAYSGVSALKLAVSFHPEVILLDIGLPGMDGYEVAGRVRDMPEIGEPLVLALTGYAQPADRERARVSGFDHYLIKPADFKELQALLARPHGQRVH